MPEQCKLEKLTISAKVEKVACIVLYGLAISQSDCRKADPYQLPCNNALVVTLANGLIQVSI